MRRPPLAVLFVVASLVGCASSSGGPAATEFSFSVEDMKKAVAGDYTGTLTSTGKMPTAVTMHLDYAPPGAKPACGNRTLCIDLSTIGMVGKVTTADGTYQDTAVTGTFDAYGTELTSGELNLHLADGASVSLPYAMGKLTTQSDLVGSTGVLGSITLVRMPLSKGVSSYRRRKCPACRWCASSTS